MADEIRVTEVVQEVEYQSTPQLVTEIVQEVEYSQSETHVTEVVDEAEWTRPDVVVTSAFQASEWDRPDVEPTGVCQFTEYDRPDVVVTSVCQFTEWLDVPPPPVPPEDNCPPFRIFWQDSNVRAHAWKDSDQTHPCLLYTSPSPRDRQKSRMPSSA